MSSFREVLSVDADGLFFTNPEDMFRDRQYNDTKALFFRDRDHFPELRTPWVKTTFFPPISYNLLQNRIRTGESHHMQESGVLVVDKWQHFVPLLLVARLNGPDRDGNATTGKVGVYDMMYGKSERCGHERTVT